MRCAQAVTARMAKGLSVGGPGDSEDNCVERNAIRTIRVGEMESGSYRAESGDERGKTKRRYHHAVLHSREVRFLPRFRRDLTAS